MLGWLLRLFSGRKAPAPSSDQVDPSWLRTHVEYVGSPLPTTVIHQPSSAPPEPPPALTRRSALPQTDNYEGFADGNEERWPVQASAWISYRDAKGQESRREIRTIYVVDRKADALIHAFCHARQDNRSFIASRITSYVDTETGEVVPNPAAHLIDLFWLTPKGQLRRLAETMRDELMIVAFVVRADGTLRQKQREIILAYLKTCVPGLPAEEKEISGLLANIGVSQQDFRKALKLVAGQPEQVRADLMAALDALAATRRSTREFTDTAMGIARKHLQVAGHT